MYHLIFYNINTFINFSMQKQIFSCFVDMHNNLRAENIKTRYF